MFKLYSATEDPSSSTTTQPPACPWSVLVVRGVPPPACPAPAASASPPPPGIKPIKQTEHLFHMKKDEEKSSCIVALA